MFAYIEQHVSPFKRQTHNIIPFGEIILTRRFKFLKTWKKLIYTIWRKMIKKVLAMFVTIQCVDFPTLILLLPGIIWSNMEFNHRHPLVSNLRFLGLHSSDGQKSINYKNIYCRHFKRHKRRGQHINRKIIIQFMLVGKLSWFLEWKSYQCLT